MTIRIVSEKRFSIPRPDGVVLAAYRWSLGRSPRAVMVIAHGMGEHARRYPPALMALLESGIDLYGVDHRGHGVTLALTRAMPGDMGQEGLSAVIDDLLALVTIARRENPSLPLILLGHSLGSFISQAFALDHSDTIDGMALAGTTAVDAIAEAVRREGNIGVALNRAFEPARTPFDWLSRDESQVDAYIADPLCGFSLTPNSMQSLFDYGGRLADLTLLAGIRSTLPLYVFVGERDPLFSEVGDFGRLIERYRAVGLQPVEARYPQGRHEILNEINRDEVVSDLLIWLDSVIEKCNCRGTR